VRARSGVGAARERLEKLLRVHCHGLLFAVACAHCAIAMSRYAFGAQFLGAQKLRPRCIACASVCTTGRQSHARGPEAAGRGGQGEEGRGKRTYEREVGGGRHGQRSRRGDRPSREGSARSLSPTEHHTHPQEGVHDCARKQTSSAAPPRSSHAKSLLRGAACRADWTRRVCFGARACRASARSDLSRGPRACVASTCR
jgi:hypothetical protein